MALSEYEILKQNVIKKYLGDLPIVKRSRLGCDVCCVGKKSIGKTFLKMLLMLQLYMRDVCVYSNFDVAFAHYRLEFEKDLSMVQGPCGVFIDDIERIASSKFLSNSEKYPILNMTLDYGKRDVTPFMWSSKRILEVDKTLYSQLDYVCEVNFVPKLEVEYEYEHYLLSDLLNYYVLAVDVYNSDGDRIYEEDWDGLDILCRLYSTKQIISRFDDNQREGGNDRAEWGKR